MPVIKEVWEQKIYHPVIPGVCEGCMICFCCNKAYHDIWSAFWKPQYYKYPEFEVARKNYDFSA